MEEEQRVPLRHDLWTRPRMAIPHSPVAARQETVTRPTSATPQSCADHIQSRGHQQ
jgi:hypothetical protein